MKTLLMTVLSIGICFSASAAEGSQGPYIRAMLAQCQGPDLDEDLVKDELNIFVNFLRLPEGPSRLAGAFKARESVEACQAEEAGYQMDADGNCYFYGEYRVELNQARSTGDIVFSDDWSYEIDHESIPYFYDYIISLDAQKRLALDSSFELPRFLRTLDNGEETVEYLYSYHCRVRGIITADDL